MTVHSTHGPETDSRRSVVCDVCSASVPLTEHADMHIHCCDSMHSRPERTKTDTTFSIMNSKW